MSALSSHDVLACALAVQRGVLRPEELAEVLSDWVQNPSRPLRSLLAERLGERWVQVDRDAGLQMPADSPSTTAPSLPERSPEAARVVSSSGVVGAWPQTGGGSVADGVLDTQLPTVKAAGSGGPTRGCRYERLMLHAEGGLGAVYLARDEELNRTVALKEIKDFHADSSGSQARFVFEAEMTGNLEHPGIVPVYGLGHYPDGRPFYAMRFVQGESFDRAIHRFHSANTTSGNETSRPLTLGQLLNRFEDVCNALAYAHSRGIIHRDLKPGNVMLGEYGETLVVDWGLAKQLTRSGANPTTQTDTATTSSAHEQGTPRVPGHATAEGDIVGTLQYMAPEQARGELSRIDERADVFGLGAILCEILTGQPPFDGLSSRELLKRVQSGELSDALARLDRCGVDPELIDLTKRCLAADPEGRPGNAAEVAKELSAHQQAIEQRLRQAELARAQAEVKAVEERKRRRVQMAMLTTAFGLLVVLGVTGWAGWRQYSADEAQTVWASRKLVESLYTRGEKDVSARNSPPVSENER